MAFSQQRSRVQSVSLSTKRPGTFAEFEKRAQRQSLDLYMVLLLCGMTV